MSPPSAPVHRGQRVLRGRDAAGRRQRHALLQRHGPPSPRDPLEEGGRQEHQPQQDPPR